MCYKRELVAACVSYDHLTNIEQLQARGCGEEVFICICDLFITAISRNTLFMYIAFYFSSLWSIRHILVTYTMRVSFFFSNICKETISSSKLLFRSSASPADLSQLQFLTNLVIEDHEFSWRSLDLLEEFCEHTIQNIYVLSLFLVIISAPDIHYFSEFYECFQSIL